MRDSRPAQRAAKRPAAHADAADDEDSRLVKADADKLFFIQMLVKDIELVPAVLDLVDNSVDGARAMLLARGGSTADAGDTAAVRGSYTGRRIDVVAGSDAFEVVDNCGGIDLTVAREYAFRFGRSEDYAGVPGSVGEFGVGMKRALFKIGRHFRVESRSASTSFVLDVDVDRWADEQGPWRFRLDDAREGLSEPVDGSTGTTVRVTRLHDTVQQDFSDPLVLGQLREQLRLRHQGAIQDGMTITLNGDRLTPFLPALLSGPQFQPLNRTYQLQQPDGTVFVKLTAGIVEAARTRDAAVDEGRAENFPEPGDAGWWVFCNDRLLLMRDRSRETGWGNGAAAYHPQYRRFRGYVFLTAANTALLPWNTTKTGVDADSRVWRQVQSQMKSALAEVQAVINRLKTESETARDTDDPVEAPLTNAIASAVPRPLSDLSPRDSVLVPKPPARPPKLPRRDIKKITYDVDLDRFADVAEALGTTNASAIGRQTFDYFYDREA